MQQSFALRLKGTLILVLGITTPSCYRSGEGSVQVLSSGLRLWESYEKT
jgi:hypothetical protein